MGITILINENQKRRLILEGSGDFIVEILSKNYEFVKKVIKDSSSQIGLNLEFLVSWGATIGGFVGPLEEFLRGVEPSLSDLEISLILTGVISSYYLDNKEYVKKIIDTIKEKGLYKPFKKVLTKSKEFKSVFSDFIGSLGITLHKVTNILSYTFILPLLPILYNMVTENNISSSEISDLSKRLIGFGLLTVSGLVLKQLISKIAKRFKGK
jgi:hypothetical protein